MNFCSFNNKIACALKVFTVLFVIEIPALAPPATQLAPHDHQLANVSHCDPYKSDLNSDETHTVITCQQGKTARLTEQEWLDLVHRRIDPNYEVFEDEANKYRGLTFPFGPKITTLSRQNASAFKNLEGRSEGPHPQKPNVLIAADRTPRIQENQSIFNELDKTSCGATVCITDSENAIFVKKNDQTGAITALKTQIQTAATSNAAPRKKTLENSLIKAEQTLVSLDKQLLEFSPLIYRNYILVELSKMAVEEKYSRILHLYPPYDPTTHQRLAMSIHTMVRSACDERNTNWWGAAETAFYEMKVIAMYNEVPVAREESQMFAIMSDKEIDAMLAVFQHNLDISYKQREELRKEILDTNADIAKNIVHLNQ